MFTNITKRSDKIRILRNIRIKKVRLSLSNQIGQSDLYSFNRLISSLLFGSIGALHECCNLDLHSMNVLLAQCYSKDCELTESKETFP